MFRSKTLLVVLLGMVITVSGCGAKSSNPQGSGNSTKQSTQSGQTIIDPTDKDQYAGAENYKKFQDLAVQNPADANAQISAGMSAFSNNDFDKAIQYYKKAIEINPKSGVAYNNIGNVYYRGLKQPKSALSYYVKATEIQPSYNYGWLNLALCQKELGNTSDAKATVAKGLKNLDSTDPIYVVLTQMQSQIK